MEGGRLREVVAHGGSTVYTLERPAGSTRSRRLRG